MPGRQSELRALPPSGSLLSLIRSEDNALCNLAILNHAPVWGLLPVPSDWGLQEYRAGPSSLNFQRAGAISLLFPAHSDWEERVRTVM